MAKGTITLYKGKGKKTGKPFRALILKAGKLNKMVFLNEISDIEMDYLEHTYGLDLEVRNAPEKAETSETAEKSQPDTSLADEVFGTK